MTFATGKEETALQGMIGRLIEIGRTEKDEEDHLDGSCEK
jgi:hypothetical protein